MRNHALTIQARTLLSQTAVLDVALLEILNRIVEAKVYALEGCDSLHTYCVKRLGMSDDSVMRRRRAATLLKRYPRIVQSLIEAREVHLTGLSLLYPVINDENAERLLLEARGKTKYEIELIVARENPKPALTYAVTRVHVPVEERISSPLTAPSLTAPTQPSPLEQTAPVRSAETAELLTARPGELPNLVPAEIANPPPVELPKAKPVEIRAPDIFQFRAMMTAATKQLLDDVLDLATDTDLNVILRQALEALCVDLRVRKRSALRRKPAPHVRDKAEFDESRVDNAAVSDRPSAGIATNTSKTNKPSAGIAARAADGTDASARTADDAHQTTDARARAADAHRTTSDSARNAARAASTDVPSNLTPELTGVVHSRRIPAAIRRFVYARDAYACQAVDPVSKQKCCARRHLHLHHIRAWAKGGQSTADNLVVYCRTHNLHQGEVEFGRRNGSTGVPLL